MRLVREKDNRRVFMKFIILRDASLSKFYRCVSLRNISIIINGKGAVFPPLPLMIIGPLNGLTPRDEYQPGSLSTGGMAGGSGGSRPLSVWQTLIAVKMNIAVISVKINFFINVRHLLFLC